MGEEDGVHQAGRPLREVSECPQGTKQQQFQKTKGDATRRLWNSREERCRETGSRSFFMGHIFF
jgi:hypothetical protein